MREVFADTAYWIAITNPKDQWHKITKRARQELGNVIIVTTDEILIEFLTSFSKRGDSWRMRAVEIAQAIMNDPNIHVVPQTRDSFLSGFERYRKRKDKAYSLQDCIAMNTMESRMIDNVLTSDRHFQQERFTILMEEIPS